MSDQPSLIVVGKGPDGEDVLGLPPSGRPGRLSLTIKIEVETPRDDMDFHPLVAGVLRRHIDDIEASDGMPSKNLMVADKAGATASLTWSQTPDA